jgi:predicted Zn-dependent protease
MRSRLSRLLFGACISLMTACVHDPEVVQPKAKAERPLLPAVTMMVASAQQHLKSGNLIMAESEAERAYRLQPQDPRVLLLQAEVAAAQKAPADAEQWALKALDYLGIEQLAERIRIWDLLARLREEQGDREGAQAARQEARRLRQSQS